ncbi:Conserved_hypothetical protein [Hexamita inflata]|uniref:Uncharacterized protein n=1 Tax=Hexamita inflata TaxID=28002 RepID=A0ABP1JU76_9EUKA
MNAFPSFVEDCYYQFKDNSLIKFDYNNTQLNISPFNHPDYSSYLRYNQLHQPVLANGHRYLQFGASIYEVLEESGEFNTLSLRFVAKIPGLQSNSNWSAYHSKLFALNSELHFTNGEEIFVLQNEHPVRVKSKIGSFYYSFLDIALRWSPKQAVYQVMNNYDERLILDIQDASCISHCSGGIIILHSVEWETAYVINMITLEIKKLEGRPELKQKNIHSIMEVNKFGYCLTEAATEDLLGPEFVQQREFLWNEYFQEQKEAFKQINFSELLNNENEEEENEEEPEKETPEQKIDKIENTLQEMKKQMNRFEKQQDLIVELLSRICK